MLTEEFLCKQLQSMAEFFSYDEAMNSIIGISL